MRALLAIVAALAAALAWAGVADQRPLTVKDGEFVSERGYVSSNSCRECHVEKYDTWHKSYHRTMSQRVTPESVLADFDGVTLDNGGEEWRVGREGSAFFTTTPDGVRRPIVQSTGSHHYQLYWYASGEGRELNMLPFVWLIEEARWVPRVSVFVVPPDHAQQKLVWNYQCLPCHSTDGRPTYLPREDGPAVADSRVAELGIACEACHGPGREHIDSEAPMVHPKRLEPPRAAQVCGQCHSVNTPYVRKAWADWLLDGAIYRAGDELTDSRYLVRRETLSESPLIQDWIRENPDTLDQWFWEDGEIRVTGREYTALSASGCFSGGELSCLNCHSPHAPDPNDQLIIVPGRDEPCLGCHAPDDYADGKHTRHAAGSPGARCMNCHMPHTSYGLLKAVRSHSITSPSVSSDLEVGRPNACNLCHLDRTLAWTADRLEKWYGQPRPSIEGDQAEVAAGPLGLLTADAARRALWAWHMGWEPAQQASGTDWAAPFLATTFDDPYAVVRYIAARSLRTLQGPFEYDFIGSQAARRAAADAALAGWAPSPTQAPEIPLERIAELLSRRDDRPVKLAE